MSIGFDRVWFREQQIKTNKIHGTQINVELQVMMSIDSVFGAFEGIVSQHFAIDTCCLRYLAGCRCIQRHCSVLHFD